MPPSFTALLRTLLLDETDVGLERLAEALKSSPEAREEWKVVCEDTDLADAACAAIGRSGALKHEVEPRVRNIVQDLLTILKTAGTGGVGFELLVLAWRSAPQVEVRLRAAQALVGRNESAGLDALVARLDEALGNERHVALQALFTRNPRAAFDELSPRFSDPSEKSGTLLVETLTVSCETFTTRAKHTGEHRVGGSPPTLAGAHSATNGALCRKTARSGAKSKPKPSSRWRIGYVAPDDRQLIAPPT